ncbi:sensor histidine kinase [Aquimarina sp. 2201CG5-10]|uniref:sensor histidine kinase n=1 Tax=Aquimarina callyspongiae TaxID=3098150 RepID=UPI002AB4C942|nr:histidine kinase [Aquimarina sp. 2201CG5-10]MDY8135948.1 histidine kinase [Aquimarina sp. 2201CG5-10]
MLKNIGYVWVIIIISLLITLLANLRMITQIYDLLNQQEIINNTPESELTKETERLIFLFRVGLKNLISEFIMLIFIIFFNYSWKDYIIPEKLPVTKRTTLLIISNILLLFVLVYADFNLEKYLSPASKISLSNKSYYIKKYFINHLPVLILAFITPYILLKIKKIQLTEQHLIKIKEEKSKAELSALKEQISPHFFFNTLSTLSTVIRNETKKESLDFIQDMSNTYHYTLTSSKANLVVLKEELSFIDSYISLLEKRFEKKLFFNISISKEVVNSKIPPMSIQLLVENAVQHNIMTVKKPLEVKIYNTMNYICIENNLQEKEITESFGIGLKNLNNRYKLITNNEITIEKENNWFRVKLPIL